MSLDSAGLPAGGPLEYATVRPHRKTGVSMPAAPLNPVDLYDVRSMLSEEERMVQDTVARFTDERVMPIIGDCFDKGVFPKELIPEMAELGLLGSSLPTEYGCAGMNAVSYGLICQELERGDSGIRSFASVQSSLCMYPIYAYGSEEQRKRWLPDMAAGKVIGCFGLTEPHGGSDPANMKTNAKKDGGDWIINGAKMWITNGNLAHIAIVWAQTDDGIQGFIVEKDMPGFAAQEIHKKMSLRASVTSSLFFDNVRVPDSSRLPNVKGLKGPLGCLTQARYGITWGPIGAAIACFTETTEYAKQRMLFQRPIAATQAVQIKLAEHGAPHHAGAIAVVATRPLERRRQDAADAGFAREMEQLPHGHRYRARMPRHPRRRRHHHRTLPDPSCAESRIRDHVRRHRDRASARGRPRSHRHQRILMD